MNAFKLNFKEHVTLVELQKSATDVRLLRRVQAILWLADGDTVEEVAARLGMTRQSIYNWLAAFEQRAGLPIAQRLSDEPRSGRPRTALGIIDPLIEAVIDQDPREWDYRATTWTAALLVAYLADEHRIVVSVPSVKLALGRLRIRWKRPRHALALRPETWRQSKGG